MNETHFEKGIIFDSIAFW